MKRTKVLWSKRIKPRFEDTCPSFLSPQNGKLGSEPTQELGLMCFEHLVQKAFLVEVLSHHFHSTYITSTQFLESDGAQNKLVVLEGEIDLVLWKKVLFFNLTPQFLSAQGGRRKFRTGHITCS